MRDVPLAPYPRGIPMLLGTSQGQSKGARLDDRFRENRQRRPHRRIDLTPQIPPAATPVTWRTCTDSNTLRRVLTARDTLGRCPQDRLILSNRNEPRCVELKDRQSH